MGIVLRILLHLHPQDKVEVVLLFKVKTKFQEKAKVKVEMTDNLHIMVEFIIPLINVWISLIVLHGLIKYLSCLLIVELIFLFLFNL